MEAVCDAFNLSIMEAMKYKEKFEKYYQQATKMYEKATTYEKALFWVSLSFGITVLVALIQLIVIFHAKNERFRRNFNTICIHVYNLIRHILRVRSNNTLNETVTTTTTPSAPATIATTCLNNMRANNFSIQPPHLIQQSNQQLNQHLNQHLNQQSNQQLNQHLNKHLNQHLNQESNQYLNQESNQYLNQESNQYLNQESNQHLNQESNTTRATISRTYTSLLTSTNEIHDHQKILSPKAIKKIISKLVGESCQQGFSGNVYVCNNGCNYRHSVKSNFETHLIAHLDLDPARNIKCSYCSFKSSTQSAVNGHMKSQH